MPTKPGDNKLGKRDALIVEAYRDKIDPDRSGVAWARPFHTWQVIIGDGCSVCGSGLMGDSARELAVKPALSSNDLRRVCTDCCVAALREEANRG